MPVFPFGIRIEAGEQPVKQARPICRGQAKNFDFQCVNGDRALCVPMNFTNTSAV